MIRNIYLHIYTYKNSHDLNLFFEIKNCLMKQTWHSNPILMNKTLFFF